MTTEYIEANRWQHINFYTSGGANGAFADSLAPGKIFKIEEVRLHLSSGHASVEDFVIRLSSILGQGFSQTFISQAMNGVLDYHWIPDRPIIFCSGDQVVFSLFIKSATNIYGLSVKGWSVIN